MLFTSGPRFLLSHEVQKWSELPTYVRLPLPSSPDLTEVRNRAMASPRPSSNPKTTSSSQRHMSITIKRG